MKFINEVVNGGFTIVLFVVNTYLQSHLSDSIVEYTSFSEEFDILFGSIIKFLPSNVYFLHLHIRNFLVFIPTFAFTSWIEVLPTSVI